MKFTYQARTEEGESKRGFIEASSREAALDILKQYGLYPTSLSPHRRPLKEMLPSAFRDVSRQDVILFTRQLSIMVRSEIPVVETLETIAKQVDKEIFKEKILKMSQFVEDGRPLSEAMENFPDMFSDFYIGMIRAGEKAGEVPQSLDYLADYLEKNQKLKSQLIGALLYPIFVSVFFVLLMFVMSIFVVPNFKTVFEDMEIELPLITQIVIGASEVLKNWWWVFLVLFFGVSSLIFYLFENEETKKKMDKLLLRVPLISGLLKKVYLSRIALNLSTLISSGVPISDALEVTADLVGNHVYQEIVLEARKEVRAGSEISSVFRSYPDKFSVFFNQMMVTGERAGKLESTLGNIVTFYEKEVDETLERLLKFIEPVLIIVLGVLVGGLALSLFIPLFQQGGLAM